MSAPLIWILFPFLVSLGLIFLRRFQKLSYAISAGLSFFLTLAALMLPLQTVFRLGPLNLEIVSSLSYFGRQLSITSADRLILVLIYSSGGFLLLGGWVSRAPRLLPSLGLMLLSVLVAALSVQPFLYAALLVELAVLICVPLLSPPGEKPGQGTLRFLIFLTLGLPFILFAGWALGGTGLNLTDTRQVNQALFLLGVGFLFWLAVFPFYTWIPMLSSETHPYSAGYVLNLLPPIMLLLLLDFLGSFPFMRGLPAFIAALRLVGVLMVLTGGIWAAFQENLGRLFGYAVIMETGYLLLAFSVPNAAGLEAFSAALIPRMVSLAVFSLALSLLRQARIPLTLTGIRGCLKTRPFTSGALVAALLSLVGLPLFSVFPVRINLIFLLAGESIPVMAASLAGMAALLVTVVRVLDSALRAPQPQKDRDEQLENPADLDSAQKPENWQEILFASGGILILVMMGLFPGLFLGGLPGILSAFPLLK